MANIVLVPLLGSDGETYSFACDAAGASAGNTPGGGLVQLQGLMSRYVVILTSSSGAGPHTIKPDGTNQAVRLCGVINSGSNPVSAALSLFDSTGDAETSPIWTGGLPAGPPLQFGYPCANGLTWALSAALQAGEQIILLVN